MAGSLSRGNFRSLAKCDQLLINMVKYILEKSGELNRDSHLCSIDFKRAYDSINITCSYNILKEFGIPKKRVNLIKMMLQDSDRKVKI
jgi:hypothetical protein